MTDLRHLFVIDPLATLNFKLDTSLRLARALIQRGHLVYIATPKDLTWNSGKSVEVHAQPLLFAGEEMTAQNVQVKDTVVMALESFHAIHMRKDPPFDIDYVTITWLLEQAAHKVRIYNHPNALRTLNEKLVILQFPKYITPALISADPDEIMAFVAQCPQRDAVVKPLHLFGGRGIQRLDLKVLTADQAKTQLLEGMSDSVSWKIVQAFNPEIANGELRVFCAGGEPIAWCLKKPAPGKFLANTAQGATLHAYEPTPPMLAMVKDMAKHLLNQGVFFVGFDIIGSYVSEINITSPRMLSHRTQTAQQFAQICQIIETDLATWTASKR